MGKRLGRLAAVLGCLAGLGATLAQPSAGHAQDLFSTNAIELVIHHGIVVDRDAMIAAK